MWIRLDDAFADHPKLVRAGPLAIVAHVRALCYAARHLTDGLIPAPVAEALFSDLKRLDRRLKPAWMVRHKLWHRAGKGYRIHDFLAYNPHREEVLRLRMLRQEFGRRGGQAKAAKQQGICPDLAPAIPASKPSKTPSKTLSKTPSKTLPRPQPQPQNYSSEREIVVYSLPKIEEKPNGRMEETVPLRTLLDAQLRRFEGRHPEVVNGEARPPAAEESSSATTPTHPAS